MAPVISDSALSSQKRSFSLPVRWISVAVRLRATTAISEPMARAMCSGLRLPGRPP